MFSKYSPFKCIYRNIENEKRAADSILCDVLCSVAQAHVSTIEEEQDT